MFKASTEYQDIEENNGKFNVGCFSDVLTSNGWKNAKNLSVGDVLCVEDDGKDSKVVATEIKFVEKDVEISYKLV